MAAIRFLWHRGDACWDVMLEEFSQNHFEKLPLESFLAGWRSPWPFRRNRWKMWSGQQNNNSSFIPTGWRAGSPSSSWRALSKLYSIDAAATLHSNTNWGDWLWKKSNLSAFLCHFASPLVCFVWSVSPGFRVLSLRRMPEMKPTETKTASTSGTKCPPTATSLQQEKNKHPKYIPLLVSSITVICVWHVFLFV